MVLVARNAWVSAWSAATCSALLALAGCGNTTTSSVPKLGVRPGERVASIPTRDPLQQAVAVVFLMPETKLAVDVISGRLFAPEEEVAFPLPTPGQHEGLIGFLDPRLHNQIFAYRNNGIPGRPNWDPRWGKAPAPGELPAWIPPRTITPLCSCRVSA